MTDDPTLPEFLLARIAEDEATYRGEIHFGCCEDDSDGPDVIHSATCLNRVLAECKAKRRIIEDHNVVHDGCPGSSTLVSDPDYQDGDYGGPCAVLRHLAAVYEKHPDYRSEWRS